MKQQSRVSPRLLRACRKEPLERPPVWMMRQAGRYLPEYQEIRKETPFLELCKTPDLAAEVSLQPLHRFGVDAVILFSDILVLPEAMGLLLEFNDNGPHLPQPLQGQNDIDRLRIADPAEMLGFVLDTLSLLKHRLASYPDVTLLGFAGAPWTLASYMIEGGVSRQYTRIKSMMYSEPEKLHQILDKVAQAVALFLSAQIEAGAQAVQLFDSWGGIVDERCYREFILPYQQAVIHAVKTHTVPVILYVHNSRGHLHLLQESGADVISLDWYTPLDIGRRTLGDKCVIQGNLDPNALFASPQALVPLVKTMLAQGRDTGYIANLGHGILPKTPIENVQLFVDTIKNSAGSIAPRELVIA